MRGAVALLCTLALASAFPTNDIQALVELDADPPAAKPAAKPAAGGAAGAATSEVTLPALTKEIANRETSEKGIAAKLAAETKERQNDAVKQAAAAGNLKTAVTTEAAQRAKSIDTEKASIASVTKQMG